MAVSLPVQKRSSVAMQVGTCSRSLTKSFPPGSLQSGNRSFRSLSALLCKGDRATENNVHAQKPQ